jgi:hypothetical protein
MNPPCRSTSINQHLRRDAYQIKERHLMHMMLRVHSDHVLISNFRFVAPKNQSNALEASSRIPRCDLYTLTSFRSLSCFLRRT